MPCWLGCGAESDGPAHCVGMPQFLASSGSACALIERSLFLLLWLPVRVCVVWCGGVEEALPPQRFAEGDFDVVHKTR